MLRGQVIAIKCPKVLAIGHQVCYNLGNGVIDYESKERTE